MCWRGGAAAAWGGRRRRWRAAVGTAPLAPGCCRRCAVTAAPSDLSPGMTTRRITTPSSGRSSLLSCSRCVAVPGPRVGGLGGRKEEVLRLARTWWRRCSGAARCSCRGSRPDSPCRSPAHLIPPSHLCSPPPHHSWLGHTSRRWAAAGRTWASCTRRAGSSPGLWRRTGCRACIAYPADGPPPGMTATPPRGGTIALLVHFVAHPPSARGSEGRTPAGPPSLPSPPFWFTAARKSVSAVYRQFLYPNTLVQSPSHSRAWRGWLLGALQEGALGGDPPPHPRPVPPRLAGWTD